MKKEDIDELFELLRIYFPNNQKVNNQKLRSAWHLLLGPYSKEAVKLALVEQLRENKNFPDAQAIATRIGCATQQKGRVSADRHDPPTPSEQRDRERLLAWHGKFHAILLEMGLPTLQQAIARGMTVGQWVRALQDKNVWEAEL